ncbi:MAG: Fic family protein [Deltaproteobacteria bacterium]|nr:Fic family protein [Deltaproteobacteria bacterium]
MEPMLPPEGTRVLEDLAVELVACSARLAGKLAGDTVFAISDLVRSMNCYYSNLIEGHNTHPVDIERALRGDYSREPGKRDLQKEAFAHIAVQQMVDDPGMKFKAITSKDHIIWIHREFCSRLPDDMLKNRDPSTGKEVGVVPGKLRDGEVLIGGHLAPVAARLNDFLDLFERRYEPENLSRVMRIIAVAASHHRLLWIHPFYDGNGRVARLFSHVYLKALGLGSGLWSVSRGLARNVADYKLRLAAADRWREGDTDGRGSLSLKGLVEFCEFFLSVCIDQVKFMESLLEPSTLVDRVRRFCLERVEAKKLPSGSFELLRELILAGPVPRSRVQEVTGYRERKSTSVASALIKAGYIRSASPRAELRLHIPYEAVEAWFPRLYPADLALVNGSPTNFLERSW